MHIMKTILEIEEDHFQTEETQRAVAQFFSGQKLITESESYGAECPLYRVSLLINGELV